jgi:hypothetical protein
MAARYAALLSLARRLRSARPILRRSRRRRDGRRSFVDETGFSRGRHLDA